MRVNKLDREGLNEACDALARKDKAMARSLESIGYPPLWSRPSGFRTLVLIILEQQVSLESARTLFKRLETNCGHVDVSNILRLGVEGLRASGLTRQKASYCFALARSVADGETSFRKIALADDESAHDMLCRLKGIGSWTANVYLLFVLRRPDVWPPGDIALMKSIGELYGLDQSPGNEHSMEMAESWRPYRAAAARMLWHAYLHRRGRL